MLNTILSELSASKTQLIAVSKRKPISQILDMYQRGQRAFGENRVQEVLEKQKVLPDDIEWHLIGHLQTNKVKYIVPFIHLIHSVDSLKILKEINKQAEKENRIVDCLLQFKVAEEDTKYGFGENTAKQMLESETYEKMENIRLCGVMGMATFTDDEVQVRKEFQQLKKIFNNLKHTYFSHQSSFKEISMGMSGDYKIAVEEGSTMVRIGSLLFGARS